MSKSEEEKFSTGKTPTPAIDEDIDVPDETGEVDGEVEASEIKLKVDGDDGGIIEPSYVAQI